LFRGAIEQRAELSFGTFLGVYPAEEAGLQKRKVHSRGTGNEEPDNKGQTITTLNNNVIKHDHVIPK
jgi:hypothetical protein